MSTLYCPNCGYNLTGLSEDRCPECGTPFDREQLTQAQSEGLMTGGKLAAHLLLMPVLFGLLGGGVFFLGMITGYSQRSDAVAIAVILVGATMLIGLVIWHARYVARRFVSTQRLRAGRRDFDGAVSAVMLWGTLFTLSELVLSASYWVGGCACIIYQM